MEAEVATDRVEIAIQTMEPVHRRGPVFFASLPRDAESPKGHGPNAEDARRRLATILWDHLMAQPSSAAGSSTPAPQVVHDSLGKPRLMLGAYRGPAISFSENGGKVWAALCGDDSDIGIDVRRGRRIRGRISLSSSPLMKKSFNTV